MKTRLLIFLLILLLTACQNGEREYIHWSEAEENVTERLRDGGVDYKVENGEIYIPKDQLKRATYCCT